MTGESLMHADLPEASASASRCFPEQYDEGQQICEDHSHCTEKFSCSTQDCEFAVAERDAAALSVCADTKVNNKWRKRTCHGAADLSASGEIGRAANPVHLNEAQQGQGSEGCARQLHAQK